MDEIKTISIDVEEKVKAQSSIDISHSTAYQQLNNINTVPSEAALMHMNLLRSGNFLLVKTITVFLLH